MADTIDLHFREMGDVLGLLTRRGQLSIQEVLAVTAESLHQYVLDQFETKGFGSWPDFWWQRRGLPKPRGRRWLGNPQLLQDTGNLVGSITPDHGVDFAEVFTNVPYAKYHASHQPRKKIPLRDFFDIETQAFEQDVADMAEMLVARITSPSEAPPSRGHVA
jgi:phage gpG-like protein